MSDILSELLDKATAEKFSEKMSRKEKCEKDFLLFCKTYLPHYFSHKPAEYHNILIDIANTGQLTESNIEKLKPFIAEKYHSLLIESKKIKAIVDIEPRGFSKSTRWAFAYPLWKLLFAKNKFICIFCASQEKANEALQNIKDEIESNDFIFEDFGKMEGDIWKSDFLTFKSGAAIRAYGAGVAVRGARYRQHRPDLIICDDILKDETSRTFAQRQKIYNWFLRAVLPLGQNIFTIVINTILHSDDLPSRLLKRIEKNELTNWVGFRFSAFTPTGESLWSDYWSKEKLLEKKREIGTAAFTTEYLNEPLSDEERVFKPEWFVRYKNIDTSELRIFMGVDPSAGKHDEFAIFTIGVSQDGIIYELDEWAECCSVDRAINKLIEKYLIYKPILIGFEEVGFQLIYKKHILETASKKGIHLPIKGCSTRGVGKERILSISPLIENGLFKWKENHNRTIDQLTMYPKSDFDDLQDACYYAWEVSQNTAGEAFAFKVKSVGNRLRSTLHRFR